MFKKVFAVASVTALTGLVVTATGSGCTTSQGGPDPPADSGTPDATGKVVHETSDAADPPDPGVCPSSDLLTAPPDFVWNPPAPSATACTQTDIEALRDLLAKGGESVITDIQTALSTTCGACAFTPETAANWGLFLTGAVGTVIGTNTDSACLALTDSGGAACGKASSILAACLDTACEGCDPTAAATVSDCRLAAAQVACSTITQDYIAACPDLQSDLAACTGVVAALAVVCGGGADGGLDASK
jgi:hypothetical protein